MKLDHFTINVSNQERSTRFYCDGLGFDHVDDRSYGNEAAGTTLLEGDYRVHSSRPSPYRPTGGSMD
jgi:catechol 2,3-dioxygenase-like lactoylglutathione lyase family enzyme